MRKFTIGTAAGLAFTLILVTTGTATAGPKNDRTCIAAVKAAGDWGKGLNPGKANFVSGTEGDDDIGEVPPGTVFCGLGGDDRVTVNNGWFYGGAGVDQVDTNNGMVIGGDNTDLVTTNNGVFEGGNALDAVKVNNGLFDGGPGVDIIEVANNGTCIDVEHGCDLVP